MAETTVSGVTVPTRLLVLGMAHEDGTVHAAEVFPVAAACGQGAEQVRSCLRRLVAEGLFARHGTGQDARYVATAAGLAAMGSTIERHRLAYAQDAAGRGWDRHWHVVAFAVPETSRAARDGFRDRLIALGGAAVHNGYYVSPHRWEKEVLGEAERLGITKHVTVASSDDLDVGGTSDPRDLARQLWPVDDLAEGYERFVDTFGDVLESLGEMQQRHERLPDTAFLPGAFAMAVAFQRCFERDPLLPPELLPRPWPGRAARELITKSRRLALRLREAHDRPALFKTFDDLIESIP